MGPHWPGVGGGRGHGGVRLDAGTVDPLTASKIAGIGYSYIVM